MMLKWFKSHDFYRHFLCLFLLQIRFFFHLLSFLVQQTYYQHFFYCIFFCLFVRFSSICVACGRFIFTSIQPILAKCDTPNIRHFPTVASKRHPRTNVVDATQQIERLWFISNFFFVSCDSCVRSTSNTQTYSISFRVLRMKRTQSKPVATYISHEGLASIDIESFISFRSFFFYFPFFVRRCSLSNVVESERQSMDHQ